ncbi:MAG: hypothetical protein OHK0029_29260 [Armatimonadaceae bacterium]
MALLLLFLPAFVSLSGCAQLTPPQVPETAQQALQEGEAKEAKAREAEEARNLKAARDQWNAIANYYGAVANKFAGTDEGLRALVEQAQALEAANPDNPMAAHMTIKNPIKQYDARKAPEYYGEARQYLQSLEDRIDEKNSKSVQYMVMDTLVKLFGNDHRYSPIIAVLAIAVIVTLVLWPLRVKQYRSMKEMQRYMPELQKLQARYKDDPQKFMVKRQEFLRSHNINEFAGCLPMLLQLPVTYFMYMVILNYQFRFTKTHFLWMNPNLSEISTSWPWPFTHAIAANLGESDLLLLVIYAVSMFLQTKLMPTTTPTDPQQAEQQRMMTFMMPIVFFVMMLQWQIASAFVLYWFASNVLGIAQQRIIMKSLPELPPLVIKGEADDSAASTAGDGATGGATADAAKKNRASKRLVSPKTRRRIKK